MDSFVVASEKSMAIWHNFSLRTKINTLLLLVLVVFLAIGLFWQYRQQRALLFAEAVDKAKIITAEATRTREYLSQQLKVGQVELNKNRYGMIPVVVANRVGQIVAEDLTYTIRHTSSRFRNQANAPDSYEQSALRRLSKDRNLHHVAEFTTLDGAPVFRYIQAAYADESCLECHGDPQQSPLFLREIYPPEQDAAYHYQVGEVIGAVSIVIPMAQIERQLTASFRSTLLTTSGFFIALVVCLGLLIRKAVLNPLRNLATTIGNIRNTGRFNEQLTVTGQDEIGELVTGFNAMVEELGGKTAQLEESEQRFRLLVETARDAIVAFLPTGKIFLVNRQAEKIFGYSRRDLLGEQLDRLFVPERDVYAEGITSYLLSAKEQWFKEVHLLKGLRQDQSQVRPEMYVTIVDTGDRPFYTATLRERTSGLK
jgi:PAS domain S-box-containing protein